MGLTKPSILLDDEAIRHFIIHGYVTVQADMPAGFHEYICQQLDAVIDTEGNPGNNILPRIPELQQVFDHPAVCGALTSLLGPGYIMHPHRYCHLNRPGTVAQRLHKDDYHYSGDRDIRHHRSRWVMAFYYPQGVSEEMGPTSIQPGTQYYLSESHDPDNAEKLLCGPAGTVTIVNFDLWHRATANLSDKRRYMLKFIFTRMAEPLRPSWNATDSRWIPVEAGTPVEKHAVMRRHLWNWLHGRQGAETNGADFRGALTVSEAIRELRAADVRVRRRAADCLGMMGEQKAIPELMEALQDEDEPVRLNAAYALGAIGESAVPALIGAMREDSEDLRRHAGYALSAMGEPAVPALIEATRDADGRVRAAAVDALGDIGMPLPGVVSALTRVLSDEYDWARRHAADALGTIGPGAREAVPALIKTLRDEKVYVRINAATALARIGPEAEESVQALTERLNDPDRYVRSFAAIALRQIGTPAAQEALLNFLMTSRWCPITNKDTPY